MTALVPHVSEQRPIRLEHRRPPPLTLGIVGLGDVDGDDAVGVAGQHRPAAPVGIREKLERQPSLRIVDPVGHRQAELDQREEQTSLGGLEAVPGRAVGRVGEIGDHPRDPTRHAERVVVVGRHRPIADPFNFVVLTEPVAGRPPVGGESATCPRHRDRASRPAADPAGRRRGGRS